jgi:CRISPR-associated protein Csb1
MPDQILGDDDMNFENVAVLAIRQKLSLAFPADPIKPPTFAGDNGATYVIYQNGNRRDVIIDTHQSQANRIEPIFDQVALIPDSTVKVGGEDVRLTALGHRVADAALRFSDGAEEITNALAAYFAGDAVPLAKIAPTSLLFGAWDSRGNPKIKITRIIRAEIRATDVSEPISVLGQYRTVLPRPEGVNNNEVLSAEGLLDCPTEGLGGVIVNGEIVRTVQLNLRGVRKLNGEALQKYVLGLGLIALLAPPNLDLREGCNLVVESTTAEAINEDGSRTPFGMTYEEALAFARQAAEKFGIGTVRHFTHDEVKVKAKLDAGSSKKAKAVKA